MSETCWANKKWNNIASDIKLVLHSSTITMMHGPIYIRFSTRSMFSWHAVNKMTLLNNYGATQIKIQGKKILSMFSIHEISEFISSFKTKTRYICAIFQCNLVINTWAFIFKKARTYFKANGVVVCLYRGGHSQFSIPFMYNVNILWTKKGNIRKYTTFCGGINEDGERKS